jgi:hypothetical protein
VITTFDSKRVNKKDQQLAFLFSRLIFFPWIKIEKTKGERVVHAGAILMLLFCNGPK